jgi:butyryl-CoA dehydrogenase
MREGDCASTGVIVSVNNFLAYEPMKLSATKEQKKKYLMDMASGRELGCLGLTEATKAVAGSDAGNVSIRAVLRGMNRELMARIYLLPTAMELIVLC